jgi:uncharacterized protein (DUF849 family)
VLIKACLNGGTTRAQHPRVPLRGEELAEEARAAVAAGAGALHVHPRDGDGGETLEPALVAAALVAVRNACPDVPVGISTGLWIAAGDPDRRLALVRRWEGRARPDFASVNLSEPGAGALVTALREAGIGVEAGVWTTDDARAAGMLGAELVRVLVEPRAPDAEAAVASAQAIEAALDAHAVPGPRLHHGYGIATWAVLRRALARGRDIRVGLEDTTVLPDGRTAAGNGELVAAAVALAQASSRASRDASASSASSSLT